MAYNVQAGQAAADQEEYVLPDGFIDVETLDEAQLAQQARHETAFLEQFVQQDAANWRHIYEYMRVQQVAAQLEADLDRGRVVLFPSYVSPMRRALLQHYSLHGSRPDLVFLEQLKAQLEQLHRDTLQKQRAACAAVEAQFAARARQLEAAYETARRDLQQLAQPADHNTHI